jgi:hypothetical protein
MVIACDDGGEAGSLEGLFSCMELVSFVTSLPSIKHKHSNSRFEAHASLTFCCRVSGCSEALAETRLAGIPSIVSSDCDEHICFTRQPRSIILPNLPHISITQIAMTL